MNVSDLSGLFDGEDEGITHERIIEQISLQYSVSLNSVTLFFEGELVRENNRSYTFNDTCFLTYSIGPGLKGGKGGFGAQLRSLAKQRGKKQTTNFGACRDLTGRRLRHINDEIILKKWKDAKENGESFDPEQETKSGIDLWFLTVPSWSEGIKVDHRKKFLKPRLKTNMCLDWLRARENSVPPSSASRDWGCPRGIFCEFAHGEDELRGAEKEQIQESSIQAKDNEKQKSKERYFLPLNEAKNEDMFASMVLEGLQASKKSRTNTSGSKTTSVAEPKPRNGGSLTELVELSSGSAVVETPNDLIILTGVSKFSTLSLSRKSFRGKGRYFYEIELLTDGLMQLGLADFSFSGGNSDDGIGVGDDSHSWSFDGLRKKLLHADTLVDIEGEIEPWNIGDVVGVCLDIAERMEDNFASISFFLNGQKIPNDYAFSISKEHLGFFPAVSLEEDEAIIINIGEQPFKFF